MKPTDYRNILKVWIQSEAWDHFAHLPRILDNDDDVTNATLALLPDPKAFATVDDYAEAVKDALDLSGHVLREELESLFTGIIYTRDLIEFQAEHEEICDDAIAELGGFSEVMADCDSVSAVICRAADYGADKMWRDAVGEFVYGLDLVLDRLDEEFDL